MFQIYLSKIAFNSIEALFLFVFTQSSGEIQLSYFLSEITWEAIAPPKFWLPSQKFRFGYVPYLVLLIEKHQISKIHNLHF